MNKKLITFLAGLAGYIAWAIMAYYDPSQRPDFLKFNIALASGAVALAVRDLQSPSP